MKMPGLFKILLFDDSRKVGWGVWFHISSEAWFYLHLIDVQTWMACKAIVATMIGGGTLADSWLGKAKQPTETAPK